MSRTLCPIGRFVQIAELGKNSHMTKNTYKKPADNSRKGFIPKSELAKLLYCTERHIDNLTARGAITKIKVGALSRYDWDDISDALKNSAQLTD